MNFYQFRINSTLIAILIAFAIGNSFPAYAQEQQIQSAVSTLKGTDKSIATYYAAINYKQLWTGKKNSGRAKALLNALKNADDHGLPSARYKVKDVAKAIRTRRNADIGKMEVFLSQIYVRYANDISTGVLRPSDVSKEIAYKNRRLSGETLLVGIAKGNPAKYLAGLAPRHSDYKSLLAEKKRLSKLRTDKTPSIPKVTYKVGSSGQGVVTMRVKLKQLGYSKVGTSPVYDAKLKSTVAVFQKSRGLTADGVAGPATVDALNLKTAQQLKLVIVNLERQRWINFPRQKRHVFVNLPDFSVAIMDNGQQSFYSRTVIGKDDDDTRSPEFVDTMTHMVINPTWHVPRSIAGKEYLPIIRKDPGFLRRKNMTMLNAAGQSVNPANVNLAAYNENNFPFNIKQRPDPANALGLVKFMFPNKYNIYLHDTPSKSLFGRDVRAFSHGCIRVHKPFDFAYELLGKQTSNPEKFFQEKLETKKETYVNLKKSVQVIIAYQTVVFDSKGRATYRNDIYGRDGEIASALKNAGVAI